jgi:hypothetical protein
MAVATDVDGMSHPGFEKIKPKPLYMCPGCSIHTYSNNMIQIQYLDKLQGKILQSDPWVQKKDYRVAWNSKRRCGFHMHNRRRGRPSLYLLALAGTFDWTPAFV